MLATIEWDKIGELLWVAPLAALAVSVTFSLMIVGSARATDAQRAGAATTAMLYSVVAIVSGLAFAAVVVFGVGVIVNK
ncbi:hypothetical protein [Baekduia sp.]|jgi:hypothetical protein|uniref:hypothetical protein n=1 Tax=Baekduia sp. TaxID=2600305 RepID=UPI002E0249AD|nr:hypothetical protein [Baekduia sp.]